MFAVGAEVLHAENCTWETGTVLKSTAIEMSQVHYQNTRHIEPYKFRLAKYAMQTRSAATLKIKIIIKRTAHNKKTNGHFSISTLCVFLQPEKQLLVGIFSIWKPFWIELEKTLPVIYNTSYVWWIWKSGVLLLHIESKCRNLDLISYLKCILICTLQRLRI